MTLCQKEQGASYLVNYKLVLFPLGIGRTWPSTSVLRIFKLGLQQKGQKTNKRCLLKKHKQTPKPLVMETSGPLQMTISKNTSIHAGIKLDSSLEKSCLFSKSSFSYVHSTSFQVNKC